MVSVRASTKLLPFRQHDPSIQLTGRYIRDNFTNNAKLWERHVLPHLPKMTPKTTPLRVLFIGSAEDGIAIEFLAHHPGLVGRRIEFLCLTDSDTKSLNRGLAANVTRLKIGGVKILVGDLEDSMLHLATLAKRIKSAVDHHWDLVYVEGFYAAKLLRLATLAFTCTRPGGLIVIDDFTSSPEHDTACPQRGVQALIDTHSPFLKVIGPSGWQAILCRRVRPLKIKGCRSEYFSSGDGD